MKKTLFALVLAFLLATLAGATEPATTGDTALDAPQAELFTQAQWTQEPQPTNVSEIGGATPGRLPGCAKIISQERCRTGGYWTTSCSQCSGDCYHTWEGWVVFYHNGKKSSGWEEIVRCTAPQPMEICNSTCQ